MLGSVLVIDKSIGPTSFDVVRDVRRFYRGEKVGHAGSLDPFATGVLVLLLGKATKLSGTLLNADKSYAATLKLGEATDTMDCTGTVIKTAPLVDITEERVREVLKSFEGEWMQVPPMYSAKKKEGVRLYELARKNIEIDREPIPVQLYRVEFKQMELPYISFEVHCSKGTYIRVLADEIGKRLSSVAHLSALRRLTCGGFSIDESVTVDTLSKEAGNWLEKGYKNYIRLLTSERLHRPQLPSENKGVTNFVRN
jgi:tRNA pseudouridine55 synthase